MNPTEQIEEKAAAGAGTEQRDKPAATSAPGWLSRKTAALLALAFG